MTIGTTDLAAAFARNVSLVKRQTEGLTQEDSLLQPPFRANCLNWVVGHLLDNRNTILKMLGAEPVMEASATARYRRESDPVTGEGAGVLKLEELGAGLERSQAGLEMALAAATPEVLNREVQAGQTTTTVEKRVFFLYFHETYHLGQTELLRQLAGKDDKVL